jgi:hypothetical protein
MTFDGTWIGDYTTQAVSTSTPDRRTAVARIRTRPTGLQVWREFVSVMLFDPRRDGGVLNQRRATSLRACSRFATHGIVIRWSTLRARRGSAMAAVERCRRFEANVWTTRAIWANEVVGWTARLLHSSACAAESG